MAQPVPHHQQIHAWIPLPLYHQLCELAKARKASKAEVVRAALRAMVESRA